MLGDQLRAAGRSRARRCPSDGQRSLLPVDERTLERAKARIAEATSGRAAPADLEAALERDADPGRGARRGRGGAGRRAAREASARPCTRACAPRCCRSRAPRRRSAGSSTRSIRRLERLEGDVLAERHARIDDLALLVDLVSSGWRGVERAARAGRARASARRSHRSTAEARLVTSSGLGSDEPEAAPACPPRSASSIRPPSATASSRAIAQPEPGAAARRVDQNGRKIRSRASAAIPGPVSATSTVTVAVRRLQRQVDPRRRPGVQRKAFESRFEMIWSTRSPSDTITGAASASLLYVDPAPARLLGEGRVGALEQPRHVDLLASGP